MGGFPEMIPRLLRLLEQSSSILVLRVDLDKLLEAFNCLVVLLSFEQGEPSEVETLHIVAVHFHDLICDANYRLILLKLVLADNKIHEACYFKSLQFVICLNEDFGLFILLLIVVSGISKVVVAIHSLVELCGFFKVSRLEKASCYALKVVDSRQLPCYWKLVEVNIF